MKWMIQSRTRTMNVAVVLIATALLGSCQSGLRPRPVVPNEFRGNQPDPGGHASAAVRYTRTFESFWWNCAALKADDIDARCPFFCSGTPAAVAGCADGASAADAAIAALVRKRPVASVQRELRARVATKEARQAMQLYFPNGPTKEIVGK